jgi:SAM-dependent methyltransferase
VKDLVENRRRISLGEKARLAGLVLKENGLLWTSLMGLYYASSAVADATFRQAHKQRARHGLPGVNSMSANKLIWNTWDWGGKGEEWTPSAEWKESVVSTFIDPHYKDTDTVLEIGPGAGRWTEFLLKRCKRLVAVDISESCVNECRKRFAAYETAAFHVGSGSDLAFVPSGTIDGVWSFDVFVHINRPQFAAYLAEFARVLRPGGVGIIHHGGSGGMDGGWRSDVTLADVDKFLQQSGLERDRQVQSWIDGGTKHEAGLYKDYITIFRKP